MINNFLYIDPGTGSMLFTLAIGIATTSVFAFRALIIKLRFILSGGKTDKLNQNKIPYLIFSDSKRYWNVFKPICDEFEARGLPLVYYTQSADDPALEEKYENVKAYYIGEGNKGFVKMNMLNAGIVMSTTPGLDVLQWKRSRNTKFYVHIPHTVDDLAGYRMFALDHYDAVLTTGSNQEKLIRKIEELRPSIAKKEIVCTGATFMDRALSHIKNLKKKQNEKKTILLAPSWGPSGILTKFGESLIDSLLKTGYEIIVRPHPQSVVSEKHILETLKEKYKDCVEWNFENDNLAVMNRADLLITDFSGIIFDWTLLFNRPFIYADTEMDTSVYDADWLDEKMWVLRTAEKIGVKLEEKDFDNIKSIIDGALSSSELSQARNEVADECWQNRGNAAVAIVDYIQKKHKEFEEAK